MLRRVFFGLILGLVVPLRLAALPFLAEVCHVFETGVWEVELLAAGDPVGYIGPVRVMRWMCIVAQYFVNSFLAPVVLFRRRLESVADVIWSKGFTQSRWDALLGCWEAVPFVPGTSGFPRIYMVSISGGFDSLGLLNDFLRQVVVSRGDIGIRKWVTWLREDVSSGPYAWLRPDFVPPSPFLAVKDPQTQSSRILVEPHLIDAEFRKAWMPCFCRSGILSSLLISSWILLEEPYLDLPRITGRDLHEVARAKKSTAGGLDGWAWNEIKALPLP